MIIKNPPCYDVSHWKIVPDFAVVNPRPFLVLTKATEALTYVDDTFVPYFTDLKQDGIHRGCFHFFRKLFDPAEQARHFCNTIRPHLMAKDILVLDVEEGGETAAQLMAFCLYVERQFPNHLLMIYSRKNILDAIAMTQAQKDYFKRLPVWTAGYPFNPDLYTTVPSFYVPDQTKWGPVWLWQYTDNGLVAGISGGVDCNWVSPILIASLGNVATPQPIADGYQELRRNNSNCHVWRGRPARVSVTDNQGLLIRPSVFAHRRAKVIINGDGWDLSVPANGYHLPMSLAWSEGQATQDEQFDLRPFFWSYRNGAESAMGINHLLDSVYPSNRPQNLVSGTRYLVKDGVNFFATSTNPEYVTNRDPRTAIGYTSDGKVITCVVDGRSTTSAGVTLKELAAIMLEAGAFYAIELDGGDSSIMLVDGVKKSRNGDLINGVRTERPTVNSIEIFTETELDPMTTGTVKSTTHALSVRPLHQTINSSTLIQIPVNVSVRASEIWEAPTTTTLNNAGDLWAKVTYVTTQGDSYTGWVGLIHLGIRYGYFTPDAVTPPPTGTPAAIDMTLAAGSVVTVKDAAGNVLWTGRA